jgi:hypothetical protein
VVRVTLTKEAVLAMEAGPEMDALVAERVMGWERGGKNDHARPAHRESKDFPGTILNDFDSKGPHDYLTSLGPAGRVYFCGCPSSADLPAYSTSIADAWEVVEKLREWHGFDFMVWGRAGSTDWEAGWFEMDYDGPERRSAADAGTVPLAICRAALLTTL